MSADVSGIRTSDVSVAGHRRLVYDTVIAALRKVFGGDYDRDPQLKGRNGQGLKITQQYPFVEADYPSIVVDYQNSKVVNAGVGHYEIFPDRQGVLRLWNHNRFEGRLQFSLHAMSSLDRDILADALVELIRFGRLDEVLNVFFETIYPWSFTPQAQIFPSPDDDYIALTQLMLDSDQVMGEGDSAMINPWGAEDTLVYTSVCSVVLHGGYYNVLPTPELGVYTAVEILAQMTDDLEHPVNPIPEFASVGWNPPIWYQDGDVVHGTAYISAVEN